MQTPKRTVDRQTEGRTLWIIDTALLLEGEKMLFHIHTRQRFIVLLSSRNLAFYAFSFKRIKCKIEKTFYSENKEKYVKII